jgi:hypothetical protein
MMNMYEYVNTSFFYEDTLDSENAGVLEKLIL